MTDKLNRLIEGVSKETQNALIKVDVSLNGLPLARVTDFDEISGWVERLTDQVEDGECTVETLHGHVEVLGLTKQQREELIAAGIKGIAKEGLQMPKGQVARCMLRT